VTAYDFAGLISGLAGAWLFLLSALVAVVAALRLAAVRRRPGKGRVARGALAFAAVIGLAGLALFLAADFAPFRRALDRHALALVGGIGGAGLLAALRAARRRTAETPEPAPAPTPGPLPPDPE
jgi:peptidoglycan/LPS O-acetylase OafA/YrhL